jgi:protein-L-isoaspartate O-methyltransferase
MYADGRHTDQAAERFARALREVGAAGAPEDLARLLAEGGTMWGVEAIIGPRE